ncbi:MAG: PTS glucose transporter subunit IIA, partial [Enterococcus sp.]
DTYEKTEPATTVINKETITSPVEGTVAELSSAKDEAFSTGTLGRGVLIHPTNGEIVAPFDGTVMTLFPTKHAVGLVSDNGLELLIHIGVDTVQLDGKYFESFVKQGDKVKQNDLLVRFDLAAIQAAGYSVETPIIITNATDYLDIVENEMGNKQVGDQVLTALI